ncbi:MAG TPA: LysR substrate-binding domain-containing protein, partial [Dongiaceae bacterium]
DLMIREQLPDLGSIIAKKLGSAAYAIYGKAEAAPAKASRAELQAMTWIGFDDDHAYMPGQAWIRALMDGKRPMIRLNNWLVLRDALRAAAGVSLLPCYLGDTDPGLARIGVTQPRGLVADVTAEQFLLVHNDLRNLPRVRHVMEAITRLFQEDRALMGGQLAAVESKSGSRRMAANR